MRTIARFLSLCWVWAVVEAVLSPDKFKKEYVEPEEPSNPWWKYPQETP